MSVRGSDFPGALTVGYLRFKKLKGMDLDWYSELKDNMALAEECARILRIGMGLKSIMGVRRLLNPWKDSPISFERDYDIMVRKGKL